MDNQNIASAAMRFIKDKTRKLFIYIDVLI